MESTPLPERDMKWKVLESTYLHKLPWLTIRKDWCEVPTGKTVEAFYVNEYPDWVNVFGLTTEGQAVMVKQYRHGVEKISIEIPGGVIELGETFAEAAARETLEETGYVFDNLEYIGKVCANPSTTNNYTHMFLGTGGRKVADQSLDEGEDVDVELMTIDEVKTLVRQGRILQSLHINTIFLALEKLGEMKY